MRSAISETGLKKDTIRRRLALAGLRSYRPVLKPKLTETHKEKRLQWAEDHVRWTQLQWRNVLFCDEASFEIDVSDKSIRCYRKKKIPHEHDPREKEQGIWICQCLGWNIWKF